MDIGECFHALKAREEMELNGLRRKRQEEEEAVKDAKKQREMDELTKMRQWRMDLSRRLKERRRERLSLEIEAEAWGKVAKAKTDELRDMEAKLNGIHRRIWQSRDEFCEEVDRFIDECDAFLKGHIRGGERPAEGVEALIAGEEQRGQALDKAIRDFEEARERAERGDDDDRKRLEKWIRGTSERCRELQTRIDDNKRRAKEARGGRRSKETNQLFSILDLNRVRRLRHVTVAVPCKLDQN